MEFFQTLATVLAYPKLERNEDGRLSMGVSLTGMGRKKKGEGGMKVTQGKRGYGSNLLFVIVFSPTHITN